MSFLEYSGKFHLYMSILFGLYWLFILSKGFFIDNNNIKINYNWSRSSFITSIIVIIAICISIILY